MYKSLLVHIVDCIHQLVKVGSGDVGTEFPTNCYKVEEFSSTDIFENDCETGVSVPIAFLVGALGPD